jgi:uncharacterized protein
MTTRFLNLLFSNSVKSAQQANGSRDAYARRDAPGDGPDALGENERQFIAARDSFYMSSIGANGWPYIQHRGGPVGFVKVLDERRLGIADFRGNRQYISVGNLADDNRAAFFFMDYPNRTRLKLLGRVRPVNLNETPDLHSALADPAYGAKIERGFIVDVEAFDWNCPQHITPRFTQREIAPEFAKLTARIAELETQLSHHQQPPNP